MGNPLTPSVVEGAHVGCGLSSGIWSTFHSISQSEEEERDKGCNKEPLFTLRDECGPRGKKAGETHVG